MKIGFFILLTVFCSFILADTTAFLFYINGDNSHEADAIALMNHLESASISDSLIILAQIDRTADFDDSNSNWVNTRRYLVTQDTDTGVIGSQFLNDIGESNMADADVLGDFLTWAETNYNADHYHLILWDYTDSWNQNNTTPHRTAFYDRTNNSYLTLPDISEAIDNSGVYVELLVLDMQYKGSMEAIFEMKDNAEYTIVSQFDIDFGRFNYSELIEQYQQTDIIDAEQAGQTVVAQTSLENNASDHSISLIRNSCINPMKDLINDFVNTYSQNREWDIVNNSITTAQSGQLTNYMDFIGFTENISNAFSSASVNAEVSDIIDYTDSLIVTNSSVGDGFTGNGLSIFVYDYYSEDWLKYKYPYCNFAARSYWKSFLTSRIANTSFKSFNCGFEADLTSQWQVKNDNNDDYMWELGTLSGDANNGERCAVLTATPGNEDHDDWLILPKVFVETGTRVQFWAKSSTNSLSDIVVRVSADDDINSDDPVVLLMSDIPSQWNRYVIDNQNLMQYEGSTVIVGIHCDDSQGDGLLIDDIDVAYTNDESVVFAENFEHGEFPPAGWTLSISNTTHTWEIGQNENHPFSDIFPNSHRSVVCNWDGTTSQDEWMITNSFSLGNEPAALMFWAGHSSAYLDNATLKVHVSSDNGVNWDQVYELVDDGQTWKWHYINVDLNDYRNSSDVKIAFQYVGLDGDLVVLDNIVVFTETTDVKSNINNYKNIVMLDQNCPNPFNPSTEISFSLPEKGEVSLNIYNIKGQLVKTLAEGVYDQGNHSVVWHGKNNAGSDCASGVYFYRLVSGKVSEIKKMVLLK